MPSFNNGFTNWDDQEYVSNNKQIQKLSKQSITKQFKSFHMGNYHPITMLSYTIEYHFAELNPKIYHTTNFIIHLLNAGLVYFFIYWLCNNMTIAFITALLFSIHPMHVESVAWVAERKDVLYTFFYFLSLCLYIQYVKNKRTIFYLFVFVAYLLSILSKGVAVTLPVIMLLTDYYLKKKINRKDVLQKLPFFILSIVFGIIAIKAQESAKALGDIKTYSIVERFLFLSYSIIIYLWKLVAPFNLSAFYDYPLKKDNLYPAIFYAAPVLLAIVGFGLYKLIKTGVEAIYGLAFFFITLLLVLQIVPVGGAIISDRYTYVPYVGIFFILAHAINSALEKGAVFLGKHRNFIKPITLAYLLMLISLTYNRCKIWKDSITLWNNVIEQTTTSPKAYNNRGDAYNIAKQYDLALKDLNRTIELKYDYAEALYNRGLCYYYLGKYDNAITDYDAAIKYDPQLAVAYFNRSGTYYALKKYDIALQDALKAKELGKDVDPKYIEALQAGMKNNF